MEKVKVFVRISGDYCAFHEMSIHVIYDITNNISLGFNDDDIETLKNWQYNEDGGGYSDVEEMDAIKIGSEYYVKL